MSFALLDVSLSRRASALRSLALASVMFSGAAHAQVPPRRTDVQLTMRGSLWFDAGYVAAGASALLVGTLALSPPDVHVAPLDGGGHRPERAGVSIVTDTVFAAGLGASLLLAGVLEFAVNDAHGRQILRAPLVLAESFLMANGVVALLKNIVGECRPRAWDDASQRCVGTVPGMLVREDRVSFPSGHTTPMGALAGASLGLWLLPRPARRGYVSLLIATGALAVTNMVLRVVAGAHTWVDTGVGLGLGFGIGLGTAALHTSSAPGGLSVTPFGVAYSGRF